jgi:hypothetical protein
MKTAPTDELAEQQEITQLIANAKIFHFSIGTNDQGQPTPETVPPHTVLVQYIRAAPNKGLITISPTINTSLYTLRDSNKPITSSPVSQKTAKKQMYNAKREYESTRLYENPTTITLALPIGESKAQAYSVAKAEIICQWLHSQNAGILAALHQRSKSLLGLAKINPTFDPFEL